jgi:ATP-binding cassette, subfamily B, bacterial
MQDLSQFYTLFQAATAAMEKLSGVLEETSSVPPPARPVRLDAAGAVEFEDVTFAYRETPVLHHVSFSIPAGQTVALVGETGAGKSTIARLIARFYDPAEGAVRLDGVDLRDVAARDLRRAIVMVTQESFLFTGSVGDNIAFGRPGATREQIEAAARAVGADGFVAGLPEGYDTQVRRRGVRLSSGQRQLVAFARAFLADPRVLILDEATSSLDTTSERLVQEALRPLMHGRTTLAIAHRLSTILAADVIFVLDRGRVVERGTHAELLQHGGLYARLYEQQFQSGLVEARTEDGVVLASGEVLRTAGPR